MPRVAATLGLAVGLLLWPSPALAANCSATSSGLVAIPDLGTGTYLGELGGLYPGGTNEPPEPYARAGDLAARSIVPRDAQGRPDANGKVVLVSVGMSNTTQEFSRFVRLAHADAEKDDHVIVVDGAQGGQDAARWVDASAPTWQEVERRLQRAGVSEAQVQALWVKQAQASPRSDFQTHLRSLAGQLRRIIDAAAQRYPNLQQVFLSPRTYGGYATTALNPEPYAYQSGFADKLVIAETVARPDSRPWVGWGPYLWTDGTKGRSDGFVWECQDVRENDGTHPSEQGQLKVAQLLQTFFDSSEFTGWYRGTSSTSASGSPATASPAESNENDRGADWIPGAGVILGLVGIGAGALIVRVLASR